MRRLMNQEQGFALVTSLMMTFISLVIVMAVFYMITQNVQRTGAFKRYKTALEASYGGTDIIVKEIVPLVLQNITDPKTFLETQYGGTLTNFSVATTSTCMIDKLTKETSQWGSTCSTTTSAKSGPDMTFQLQATGGRPYTVYSKIIDTVNGNTDISGLQLGGAGVAESSSIITPQHIPYVYRMEVQTERSTNATEQANLSVVYAY